MSSAAYLRTLFAYHWGTTERLAAAAEGLETAAYRERPGPNRRSAHELLLHLLRVDRAWRLGLETGAQPAPLPAEQFPDLAALRAGFAEERAAWDALLAGLDDAAVGATVALTSLRGDTWPIPRWRALHHVVIHGMQHHAELAEILTDAGRSPGDIDFIFYRG